MDNRTQDAETDSAKDVSMSPNLYITDHSFNFFTKLALNSSFGILMFENQSSSFN